MARLEVIAGPGTGKSFPVERPVILGRQKGVNIVVEDVAASREHAKVFTQDGDFFVIDLNSRNGTKVNETPVTRWRLNHGDVITIGKTEIRFDAPELAPAPPPPKPAAAPAATPATAAAAAPRGPGALERERERLRREAEKKAGTGASARAGDGSGIVVKETVLQFGRHENRGGLLKEDVAQRGGLFKVVLALLLLAFFAGVVWGVVKLVEKEPVDEDLPADAGGGG